MDEYVGKMRKLLKKTFLLTFFEKKFFSSRQENKREKIN